MRVPCEEFGKTKIHTHKQIISIRITDNKSIYIYSCSFNADIGDLLSWLSEVDSVIAASKPVGGLPETATEQLERFMVRID